ncbi:rap1 GTPase-GDP dissociation stimulator, putative [Ixodes scapularis]|uniref:Rap1 GTPase-GDP dissociation stimulator, putative n=1 Tax=Ixodes scapularis TaxID=6945 RepID=B7P924_IXOSC|nr:rap1 GTPase-GDP dissociation stimulator, putative [Ixodes scapularis]|eukprot:XP_002403550.1 rap1 GTPase-GDP dissociation stimulator, putative [Ixodes scapularis]
MKCLLIPLLPRRCSLCFSHLAKNTDDIADILSELKLSAQQEKSLDESALLGHLKKLLAVINADGQDQTQVAERLARGGFASTVKELLKLTSTTRPEVLVLLVQAIAEAAKNDVLRKLCSDPAVIEPLLGLVPSSNYSVVLQACRALGNICYDNDEGREIVRSKQGMEQLLQLLQNLLEVDVRPDNLHTVVSGCLLNLTDMQDCGRKHLLETRTLSLLLANLDRNFSVEVIEVLLELFGNLAENDSVKENLAQLGFCEKLLNVLRQFQGSSSPSEEKQNVVKTVCDLIVLILTGDASMRHMYQNGSGAVYKTTVSWLQSDDDTLKVAGALATGNFARKDDHCIQMVRDGVARRLLDLLNDQTGNDGDIRLQHALLAALRNLAIPLANKPLLAELGAVDKLLSMLAVETFPVVFKLLGTLRMLVDKQEAVATKLGLNEQLVKHLVTWCSTEDHPGVKGESVRLLAWLVKNSASSEVKASLCRGGALPHLVAMLGSEHGVMQNEGLLAVALVAASPPDIAVEELKKTEVVPLLHTLLVSPDIASEPLLNSIALTTALSNLGPLKPMLAAGGFKEALTQLKGHHNQTVSRAAAQALEVLEKP